MSLNADERRIMVAQESSKARRTLAQAESLRRDGHWDGVANRLYYAAFHAVGALLIRDGLSVKTHNGAGTLFRELYIKTGLLPVEVSELYSILQTMRDKADYNCSFEATQDLIEPLMEKTQGLVESVLGLIDTI